MMAHYVRVMWLSSCLDTFAGCYIHWCISDMHCTLFMVRLVQGGKVGIYGVGARLSGLFSVR